MNQQKNTLSNARRLIDAIAIDRDLQLRDLSYKEAYPMKLKKVGEYFIEYEFCKTSRKMELSDSENKSTMKVSATPAINTLKAKIRLDKLILNTNRMGGEKEYSVVKFK